MKRCVTPAEEGRHVGESPRLGDGGIARFPGRLPAEAVHPDQLRFAAPVGHDGAAAVVVTHVHYGAAGVILRAGHGRAVHLRRGLRLAGRMADHCQITAVQYVVAEARSFSAGGAMGEVRHRGARCRAERGDRDRRDRGNRAVQVDDGQVIAGAIEVRIARVGR